MVRMLTSLEGLSWSLSTKKKKKKKNLPHYREMADCFIVYNLIKQ